MSGCGLLFKVALHRFGRLDLASLSTNFFLNSLSDSFAAVLYYADNFGVGHMV